MLSQRRRFSGESRNNNTFIPWLSPYDSDEACSLDSWLRIISLISCNTLLSRQPWQGHGGYIQLCPLLLTLPESPPLGGIHVPSAD